MSIVRTQKRINEALKNYLFPRLFGKFDQYAAERGIPISRWGKDDPLDAFRHVYVSAIMVCQLHFLLSALPRVSYEQSLQAADVLTDFCGFVRKKKIMPRPGALSNSNMDMWNEALGRRVAMELIKSEKITPKSTWEEIERIVADRAADAVKNNESMNAPDNTHRYESRFERGIPQERLMEALQVNGRTPATLRHICMVAYREAIASSADGAARITL